MDRLTNWHFLKKMSKWPPGIWNDAQYTNHQGNVFQNHSEILPHTC